MQFSCIALITLLFSTLVCTHGSGQTYERHATPTSYVLKTGVLGGLVFDILQDQQGFMWFATEQGLFRYDGYEFKAYKTEPDNTNSLSSNVIDCLLEDDNGNLWVGTQNNGLNHLNLKTGQITRFQHQPYQENSIAHNRIQDLCQDIQGNIWIATDGGGVSKLDPKQLRFTNYQLENERIVSNHVHALHRDSAGTIWVGTYQGLLRYQASTDDFQHYDAIFRWDTTRNIISTIADFSKDQLILGTKKNGVFLFHKQTEQFQRLPQKFTRAWQEHTWSILQESPNRFWVGTQRGIMRFAKEKGTLHQTDESLFHPVDSNNIRALYRSRSGLIWFGTNQGVTLAAQNFSPFEKYFIHYSSVSAEDHPMGINALDLYADSLVWIGTDFNIFQFNLNTRQFLPPVHPIQKIWADTWIETIFTDSAGNIWISSIGNVDSQFELWRFSAKVQEVENWTHRCKSFYVGVTRDITEDNQGNLWFATWDGLVQYSSEQDTFFVYQKEEATQQGPISNQLQKVLWDVNNEKLWIGTSDAGLSCFDPNSQTFEHFQSNYSDTTSLIHNQVQDIFKGRSGQTWIATTAGLSLYLPDQQEFRSFYQSNGNNDFFSILDDTDGNLWLATRDAGLVYFHTEKEQFRTFQEIDGLQDDEFWQGVKFQATSGLLGFGGNRGFNILDPSRFRTNAYLPPVVLVDFLLFNQSLPVDSTILTQTINYTKHLTLRHDQDVFTIRYAALNFLHSEKNQYAYQLVGFDQDWQYVGNKREVTYTNLDPGNYTFRVKAANNDGLWNEQPTELQLTILSPWWASWWFYSLLILLIAGFTIWLYRFQLKRKLAQAEASRLKEIDRLRTKLYTNITHEFRTPLTIILGMADEIRSQAEPTLAQGLLHIRKSGQDLLNLVNQMLDLNRLEAGKMVIQYSQADIISFLHYLLQSFESLARQREIGLFFATDLEKLEMDFDPQQLQHVISNLLSNALKFTPAKGRIALFVQKLDTTNQLEIRISDTGVGIPAEHLPHIFERYYRADHPNAQFGMGIGLALAKQLVERMHGTISVNSQPSLGTTFTVLLPITQTAARTGVPKTTPTIVEPSLPFLSVPTAPTDAPLILVVEDDPEVQQYLHFCLAPHYQIEQALDGQQGWQKALELTPDFIISDVMMPEIDGFTLCNKLKTDQRTSHIPVILLTAKADAESRLTGLQRGADAYLAKPFDKQELLVRIEQLLELRRRLQAFYLKRFGITLDTVEKNLTSDEEQLFLEKIQENIDSNLENENFTVELLCREIGLSHSQLHRKMTALTGQSTQKFIRSIQLNKAKHFLSTTDLSISEIAYRSGFNDPAYFARIFKKAFQQTPRQFRKSHQ